MNHATITDHEYTTSNTDTPIFTALTDPRVKLVSFNFTDAFVSLTTDESRQFTDITREDITQAITQLIPADTTLTHPLTHFYNDTYNVVVTASFNDDSIETATIKKRPAPDSIDSFIKKHKFELTTTSALLSEIETNGTIYIFGLTDDPTLQTTSTLSHLAPYHTYNASVDGVTLPDTDSHKQSTLSIEQLRPNNHQKDCPQFIIVHAETIDECQKYGSKSGLYINCTEIPFTVTSVQ